VQTYMVVIYLIIYSHMQIQHAHPPNFDPFCDVYGSKTQSTMVLHLFPFSVNYKNSFSVINFKYYIMKYNKNLIPFYSNINDGELILQCEEMHQP